MLAINYKKKVKKMNIKAIVVGGLVAIAAGIGFVSPAEARDTNVITTPDIAGWTETDAVRYMNEQGYPYIIASRSTASGERICRVLRVYDRGMGYTEEKEVYTREDGSTGLRNIHVPYWKGYGLNIACT